MEFLIVKEFMESKMGVSLYNTISRWDYALTKKDETNADSNYWKDSCCIHQHEWNIFKLALEHFYGMDFSFTRTDEYFGVCTEDESVWLMKVYRKEE